MDTNITDLYNSEFSLLSKNVNELFSFRNPNNGVPLAREEFAKACAIVNMNVYSIDELEDVLYNNDPEIKLNAAYEEALILRGEESNLSYEYFDKISGKVDIAISELIQTGRLNNQESYAIAKYVEKGKCREEDWPVALQERIDTEKRLYSLEQKAQLCYSLQERFLPGTAEQQVHNFVQKLPEDLKVSTRKKESAQLEAILYHIRSVPINILHAVKNDDREKYLNAIDDCYTSVIHERGFRKDPPKDQLIAKMEEAEVYPGIVDLVRNGYVATTPLRAMVALINKDKSFFGEWPKELRNEILQAQHVLTNEETVGLVSINHKDFQHTTQHSR